MHRVTVSLGKVADAVQLARGTALEESGGRPEEEEAAQGAGAGPKGVRAAVVDSLDVARVRAQRVVASVTAQLQVCGVVGRACVAVGLPGR